jgi:hypothetical protein
VAGVTSLAGIATVLNERGIPTASGRATWQAVQVSWRGSRRSFPWQNVTTWNRWGGDGVARFEMGITLEARRGLNPPVRTVAHVGMSTPQSDVPAAKSG